MSHLDDDLQEGKPSLNEARIVTEVPGWRSRQLAQDEAPYLVPGIQSIASLSGLAVARADGSVIEDVDGNRYPDLAAGVCDTALGILDEVFGLVGREGAWR